MTQSSAGPRRLARQARLMNLVNVPMRFLLRLPITTPLSGQLMLLHLTGRKTGKTYLQPVSFVRDGDTLLTPGGGRWKLNLREGECIHLHLGGRDRLARPELVTHVDEVETLLRKMAALNPRITSFAPLLDLDARSNMTWSRRLSAMASPSSVGISTAQLTGASQNSCERNRRLQS